MKIRIKLACLAVPAALLLSGCASDNTVSVEKYNELKAQYEELDGRYDGLKTQYDELNWKYDELTGSMTNCKKSLSRRKTKRRPRNRAQRQKKRPRNTLPLRCTKANIPCNISGTRGAKTANV